MERRSERAASWAKRVWQGQSTQVESLACSIGSAPGSWEPEIISWLDCTVWQPEAKGLGFGLITRRSQVRILPLLYWGAYRGVIHPVGRS
jgi:hypothetical protein